MGNTKNEIHQSGHDQCESSFSEESGRSGHVGEQYAMRFERFGGYVLRVIDQLPDTRAGRHIQDQLMRAGTAIGAHHAEAQGAQSRDDFVHKLSLALKEAREARYWLGIVYHGEYLDTDIEGIYDESSQIVAMLQAAQKTARTRA